MKAGSLNSYRLFQKDEILFCLRYGKLIRLVKHLICEMKYAWQRIRRGFCDRDVWNLYSWFLIVIPDMLQELRDTAHGYPAGLDSKIIPTEQPDNTAPDDEFRDSGARGQEQWNAILERMIFLFRESDEEQCCQKNPHQEEYDRAQNEFTERFGIFREKLRTAEDSKGPGIRVYFPGDVEEYREISRCYFDEERKLAEYREQSKDEAFRLFTKWFYALWD